MTDQNYPWKRGEFSFYNRKPSTLLLFVYEKHKRKRRKWEKLSKNGNEKNHNCIRHSKVEIFNLINYLMEKEWTNEWADVDGSDS